MANDNRRETGARKLEERGSRRTPAPDTGDKGDRPKKPYGLTRPVDDTDDKTRQSDGRQPTRGDRG